MYLESQKFLSKRDLGQLGQLQVWNKPVLFRRRQKMILFTRSLTGFHLVFQLTSLLQ